MAAIEVTFNGLTIGGTTDYSVGRIEGVDGLPIRTSSGNLTNRDGGNIWSRRYGMRTIIISGDFSGIDASDYFDTRKALISAYSIQDQSTMSIQRWDGITRNIEVEVTQAPEITEEFGFVTDNNYRLAVVASNPFFLDSTIQSYSTGFSDEGGMPLGGPLPSPLGPKAGGAFTIKNNGDVSSYADFKIYGDITNGTVTNSSTGESFRITGNIISGDYIHIYKNQQGTFVMLNGVTNLFSRLEGSLFEIEPGNNVINFTGTSSGTGARLDSTFTSQYLSL